MLTSVTNFITLCISQSCNGSKLISRMMQANQPATISDHSCNASQPTTACERYMCEPAYQILCPQHVAIIAPTQIGFSSQKNENFPVRQDVRPISLHTQLEQSMAFWRGSNSLHYKMHRGHSLFFGAPGPQLYKYSCRIAAIFNCPTSNLLVTEPVSVVLKSGVPCK